MNARETNIILRQKVRTELAAFRRKLLSQNQQYVLDHACEYATKTDMVTLINETEFSADEARAMLTKPKLLDALFKEYGNHSSNSMDVLVCFMKDKAEEFAEEYMDRVNDAR